MGADLTLAVETEYRGGYIHAAAMPAFLRGPIADSFYDFSESVAGSIRVQRIDYRSNRWFEQLGGPSGKGVARHTADLLNHQYTNDDPYWIRTMAGDVFERWATEEPWRRTPYDPPFPREGPPFGLGEPWPDLVAPWELKAIAAFVSIARRCSNDPVRIVGWYGQ